MSDSVQASKVVYFASFGALLGALSMGLALGYTALALTDMEKGTILDKDKDKRASQKSLIGSMLAVGALIGGLLGGPCNKALGRRISLIVYGAPFILGWLLMAMANGISMLVLGRLLTGLCCGLVSGTAPTYVVEIAPPKIRGLLGTCFQVMVVIGILLAAIFGSFLSWSALAGLSLVPSIAMSGLMFLMPETPQWLLSKGRNAEAQESLTTLRSSPINEELDAMQQSARLAEQSGTQFSLDMISSWEFIKPLLLALGLMFFQQFSDINAVLFYQSDIFKETAPNLNASQATILVCLAQVIMTLLGSFLVDRLGRIVLLLISGAGHTISLLVFGFYSYKSNNEKTFQTDYSWLALASLIVFISSFSIGFGPIPWMMIPEFSSARVRSLVASIATAFNWTCVYVVTATAQPLKDSLGAAATWWMFAFICALSCVFVYLGLPETKGKTPDQIQVEMFGQNSTGQQQQQQQQQAGKQIEGQQMKLLA